MPATKNANASIHRVSSLTCRTKRKTTKIFSGFSFFIGIINKKNYFAVVIHNGRIFEITFDYEKIFSRFLHDFYLALAVVRTSGNKFYNRNASG
jgi:hypothetical protein